MIVHRSTVGAAASWAPAIVAVPIQVSLDALLVEVLLFGLGLWMVYHGFREYQVGRLIRDTATETVRGAAVGRTELEGTATPVGRPLARPFTAGDCLYVRYRIQEEREDADGDTSWTTLEHDTWVTDFVLDDGTGTILVEPEVTAKVEVSDEHRTRIDVPAGRSEPPVVADFLQQGTDVDPTTRHRRRYTEAVIPPGTTVYVLGGAEIRDHATGRDEDTLVVRRDDGSDRFVISDLSEAELTSTLSRRAPLMILLGIGLSALSLYLLLAQLGVG